LGELSIYSYYVPRRGDEKTGVFYVVDPVSPQYPPAPGAQPFEVNHGTKILQIKNRISK